jgi:HSP20 family protein
MCREFRMSWRYSNRRKSRNNSDDNKEDSDDQSDGPFDLDFRFEFGDIDSLIQNMFKTARSIGAEGGPVYYGYSVTTGPDGRPRVREFGNVKPTRNGTFEVGSRQPFVDTVVDEKENKLKVVAEMPGLQREDIHLRLLNDSLAIQAERGERKYNTTVPLRVEVDPSSASAAYNNGVLEVSLKLKAPPQSSGVNIKVD